MVLPYCTVADVERKLDIPDLAARGDGLVDQARAKIQAASQRWDRATGTPLRTIRVGSPAAPETLARHDASDAGGYPLLLSLAYGDIVPIDAGAGDVLEVRTGRDEWEDVTDQEGEEWVLDYDTGELKLFRLLVRRVVWEDPTDRIVRLSYRAGGLGGDRQRGAQTSLAASLSETATSVAVANAGRLPEPGSYLTVGTPAGQEYVLVTAIDRETDTLTVDRGQRGTTATAHGSEATVLYAPLDVREAVAARVCAELVKQDDALLSIPDDGQLVGRETRAQQWERDWDETAASYSAVRTL